MSESQRGEGEPCDAAKLLAYQDAHDVARELGYPSLTEALEALAATQQSPEGWQDISTAPTDSTKFDAWCVHPDCPTMGVRLTDVQMRGDGSGFGFVVHGRGEPLWQYLDARDEGAGFPPWHPTHWRSLPAPPVPSVSGGEDQCSNRKGDLPTEQAADGKARFRKTATIEAVQWFKMGDHPAVILKSDPNRYADEGIPWIPTLEGGHVVTPGDWIATGAEGEHWPIKPDIFAKTYVRDDGRTGRNLSEPVSPLTAELHRDTALLVNSFAIALAHKLLAAQKKYGFTNGWYTDDWEDKCRADLLAHVAKGDPLDVAAYAAFCWARCWSTSIASSVGIAAGDEPKQSPVSGEGGR